MSDTAYVSTGIALTPRILAGMLTGSSVMGINWAAKFAEIGDNEVFENATIPTLRESLGNAGDDIFHWNANYIIHMLSVENLDNASVRKAANFYERFADADPVGGLFALFMLSLLGPANFDQVVERLGEAF